MKQLLDRDAIALLARKSGRYFESFSSGATLPARRAAISAFVNVLLSSQG
jgi:hypothetical protein